MVPLCCAFFSTCEQVCAWAVAFVKFPLSAVHVAVWVSVHSKAVPFHRNAETMKTNIHVEIRQCLPYLVLQSATVYMAIFPSHLAKAFYDVVCPIA